MQRPAYLGIRIGNWLRYFSLGFPNQLGVFRVREGVRIRKRGHWRYILGLNDDNGKGTLSSLPSCTKYLRSSRHASGKEQKSHACSGETQTGVRGFSNLHSTISFRRTSGCSESVQQGKMTKSQVYSVPSPLFPSCFRVHKRTTSTTVVNSMISCNTSLQLDQTTTLAGGAEGSRGECS